MNDVDPPSPCVKICALNAEGTLCVGCWRSTSEIAGWATMSASDKRDALARTDARRAARREEMRLRRRQRALERRSRI